MLDDGLVVETEEPAGTLVESVRADCFVSMKMGTPLSCITCLTHSATSESEMQFVAGLRESEIEMWQRARTRVLVNASGQKATMQGPLE